MHGRLPSGVAAARPAHIVVGMAQGCFAGARAVVHARPEQTVLVGKAEPLVFHAGRTNCGPRHKLLAVRQVPDYLPRKELSAHSFASNQDFRPKLTGLLARALG